MTDTIHSCSPFCTLPACVKQRQRLEFEACCRVEGGINTSRDSTPPANGGNGEYLYACTNQAWWAWQAATERATAQQDANRLDFLSKQVDRWHTGDGGYSARLKFRWEDSIVETSLRDAIDTAIQQGGAHD